MIRIATARRTLRTALSLSARDWRIFADAMRWLAFARAAIVLLPFPSLSRRLGVHMQESTHNDDSAHLPLLRHVRWAVAAASKRAPWRCKCLEQAIAAKMMLRSRGIANTLYLGISHERPDDVLAHAWLRCGSLYVTGGEIQSRHKVVSTFADRS